MGEKALVVLTGKSRERLRNEGGTCDWALRPAMVRNFKHVICTRHANPPYDPGPGARPEPHGAAFLVAKIADVQFTYRQNDRDRFLVTFETIADVIVPDFWDGSRNPVRYMDVSEVKTRGIDFAALEFKPFVPAEAARPDGNEADVIPLTILAAKRGLAANFGVPIEAIDITIRG
ncbi:MAG: hypothetical protein JWL84_2651 [Rhodospirillales bacterium]|nr:hypothetical protein [Rhodospirillales bacterium]